MAAAVVSIVDKLIKKNLDDLDESKEGDVIKQKFLKCIVCEKRLDIPSDYPTHCGSRECDFKAEELLVGRVVNMTKASPDIIRFVLETSLYSARSARREQVFEPCPSNLLLKPESIKRGTLSSLKGQTAAKDFRKIDNLINGVRADSVVEMIEQCGDDQMLREVMGENLYTFIRFLIMSNKTLIKKTKLFEDPKINAAIDQYEIIHRREVEEEFKGSKDYREGVNYFFHGSSEENWHSILRNGLKVCSNTKMMTAGAAYGHGIYMSGDINTSIGYAGGSRHIVAVCEVAGNKANYQSGPHYVINKNGVILIRYLLVFKKNSSNFHGKVNEKFGVGIHKDKIELSKYISKIHGKCKRLHKEFMGLQTQKALDAGIKADLVDDSNLYHWKIFLFNFDKDSKLVQDMQKYNVQHIEIDVRFPKNYPLAPPFIHVVQPIFKDFTGHVTRGGAICMENITSQGWSPITRIESLMIQVHANMTEKPQEGSISPAKLGMKYDYNTAKTSFNNVARQHGWH